MGNGEIRPRDLIAEAATVRIYPTFSLAPIGSFADHAGNTIFPFPLPPRVSVVCHKSPGHSAAEEGREYVNPFFCLSLPFPLPLVAAFTKKPPIVAILNISQSSSWGFHRGKEGNGERRLGALRRMRQPTAAEANQA
jgi:hypothetical protein